ASSSSRCWSDQVKSIALIVYRPVSRLPQPRTAWARPRTSRGRHGKCRFYREVAERSSKPAQDGCPRSFAATLVALPSMSRIPSAPFNSSAGEQLCLLRRGLDQGENLFLELRVTCSA